MLSKEEFRKTFDRLVNTLWTLQDRISELEEFDRQWLALFDHLKSKTGKEARVHIQNGGVYRAFRWDKLHVLVSDLLSALQNEFQNEDSACCQSIHYLQIHSAEFYLEPKRPINHIYPPGFPVSEEDEKRREEQIRQGNARRMRDHCVDAMKGLFPNIGDDLCPTASDLNDLKSKLRSLAKEIDSTRQVFAHKHQELIVARHSAGLEKANLEQLKSITEQLFSIVQKIGLIDHLSSYDIFSQSHRRLIQDQIDLIIFGSITGVHIRFYEDSPPSEHYWQARKKYYESDRILTIISKSPET